VSLTRVTTTCPQCATIFRVNPEQLAARRGQVRCGRCRHVFNGYETVSIGPIDGLPQHSSKKNQDGLSSGQKSWWGRMTGEAFRSRKPNSRVMKGSDARDEFGFRVPFWKQHLAKIVFLLSLGIGLVVFLGERAAIVQLIPGVRPLYVKLLSPFGLRTPYPGDAELWTVESSDLRDDAKDSEIFHLSATLRNRSKRTQALPYIDLNITDIDGLSIEHQTIKPDQYISDIYSLDQGLPGNSELSFKLELRHSGKKGQGYRIVLFFP
jgi:predicted Zn finger-like uncharacterized protein